MSTRVVYESMFGNTIAERCVSGDIDIHIDRTFGLDEVPQALAHVGDGRAFGKVVVEVA